MSKFQKLRVGDHISLLSGFPFNSEYFDQEEGIRLIRVRDLLNHDGETYFRGTFDDKWLVRSLDILIGMDGDFNIVRWKGNEALLNQRILKAEAKSNGLIDEGYFFYWCAPLLQQIHNQTAATTVKHLSVKDLEGAKGIFPDKRRQAYIAEILSTLDEAIEQSEVLITKMQQVKVGLMHDLFTRGVTPDGRLRPTRKQAPKLYKESPIGWIPKEWESVLLDTLAQRGSGHTPNKNLPEYWDGGIKWVSLADSWRLDRVHISETDKEISEEGIANSSAVLHPPGIVVLSRDAGVGKSAITTCSMAVSQHFMCWLCGSQLNNYYLYYWLQANKRDFENIATGSTIPTIGLRFFKQYRINAPREIEEQKHISQTLLALDQFIFELEDDVNKLKSEKHGLMHDLLTGRGRVVSENRQ